MPFNSSEIKIPNYLDYQIQRIKYHEKIIKVCFIFYVCIKQLSVSRSHYIETFYRSEIATTVALKFAILFVRTKSF